MALLTIARCYTVLVDVPLSRYVTADVAAVGDTLRQGWYQSINERVELEMKIMNHRALALAAVFDAVTLERINGLVVELRQKLKEIDE